MAKKINFDKVVHSTFIAAIFDVVYFIEGEFVHGLKVAYSEYNADGVCINARLDKCTKEFNEDHEAGEICRGRIAFDPSGRALCMYVPSEPTEANADMEDDSNDK